MYFACERDVNHYDQRADYRILYFPKIATAAFDLLLKN